MDGCMDRGMGKRRQEIQLSALVFLAFLQYEFGLTVGENKEGRVEEDHLKTS